MSVRTVRFGVLGFAMAIIASGVVGCSKMKPSSWGGGDKSYSDKAVVGLQETRDELAKGRQQVVETIAASNTLKSAQGDISVPYKAFAEEVKQMEKEREAIAKRSSNMRVKSEEYQRKWQEEVSKMTSPELRAAATQRADKVRERYERIRELSREASDAYDPFIRDLKDVQGFLAADTTPGALTAASASFEKVDAQGKVLLQKIDALSAELADVAGTMAKNAPPPAAK